MRARKDTGETLVEIMLTIVIIGLTVTALLSSLASAGSAGNLQRISVQADTVLRDYAAVTKAAAQRCVPGAPFTVSFVPPTHFAVSGIPAGTLCAGPNTVPQPFLLSLTLTVTGPAAFRDSVEVVVRTP